MKMTSIGKKSSIVEKKNAGMILLIDGGLTLLVFAYFADIGSAESLSVKEMAPMFFTFLIGTTVTIIHLVWNAYIQELKFWAQLPEDFWVIDWGPWGKDAFKHLNPAFDGHVMFVPGSEVRTKMEYVKKMIAKSRNPMYNPELINGKEPHKLKVRGVWFRRGQFVGESAKQYKKRFNADILDIKVRTHTVIDTAEPGSGFDKEAYDKIYIDTHLNGSQFG